VLSLVCSLALSHQFFQQTLPMLIKYFVARTAVRKHAFLIHFVITSTAEWNCNELTGTFAHDLQLYLSKALLCQESTFCPIFIRTCSLLTTCYADTNGSTSNNSVVWNSERSAFNSQWELSQIFAKKRTTRWHHLDQGSPRLRVWRVTLRFEEKFADRKERNSVAMKTRLLF